jgi:hypothetical protein
MVTMVKFLSSLLALASLALLVACQPAASDSSSPDKPADSKPMTPADVGAATEDGWTGIYESEDPQVLKDDQGREIKMSPGFADQLGGIRLELRADMTFEFSLFGNVSTGKWERPDPTTVKLTDGGVTYLISRNQSAGTILMASEGKKDTPLRLKKKTEDAP